MKKKREKAQYSVDPIIRAKQKKDRMRPIIMKLILIASILIAIVGIVLMVLVNVVAGIIVTVVAIIPGIVAGVFLF